jgi:hypothetical protein
MNTKTCLKCGHAAQFVAEPPTACPACGAIYAKVEAAMASAANGPASRFKEFQDTEPGRSAFGSAGTARSRMGSNVPDVHAFAEQMREQSLYPTWRKIVGVFTILGYVLAVLVLVGSIIAARQSMGAMFGGIVLAAFIAVMARVGKELSLMLADLSDAAVHLAARQNTDK